MTNQQILTKAISQAIDSGLDLEALLKAVGYYLDTKPETMTHWQDYIYRHDFAKAMWPTNGFKTSLKFGTGELKRWQYNLAQMVLSDDPIKYLGENL